jgi:hypothetical protein
MQPALSQKGRTLLIAVTLIALALQAMKLGSRGLLLHRWPTAGQWGQLGLVVWLVISLWEGKAWARVAAAIYYSLAALVGVVFLFLMWPKTQAPLLVLSVLTVVLAGAASLVLWFSDGLRWYMAERRAANQPPQTTVRAMKSL